AHRSSTVLVGPMSSLTLLSALCSCSSDWLGSNWANLHARDRSAWIDKLNDRVMKTSPPSTTQVTAERNRTGLASMLSSPVEVVFTPSLESQRGSPLSECPRSLHKTTRGHRALAFSPYPHDAARRRPSCLR